jgi:hypothetical protein
MPSKAALKKFAAASCVKISRMTRETHALNEIIFRRLGVRDLLNLLCL